MKGYLTELSSDSQAKLWENTLQPKLFDLVHSHNVTDNYGGVIAIGLRSVKYASSTLTHGMYSDHLLGLETDETHDPRGQLFRFFNYIKYLLPSNRNNDWSLMTEASKTLGRILATGGAHFGERFMDLEVPQALEHLSAQSEFNRYAGVLILKEFARNSDIYFHSHIGTVVDVIAGPLRDQRLIVREGAAELLAACLEIIISRNRNDYIHSPYLMKIFAEAQMGLKQTQPEVIHGSLLAYRELFLHAGMVRFSLPYFE